MKKKNNKIKENVSRRNFLKGVGATSVLSLSPLQLFLTNIVNGLCQDVHAAGPSIDNVMNYVHLNLHGAPARWMFDLPLKPNGEADTFVDNQMLITKFNNSSGLDADYHMMKYGKYYYPYLWSLQVPKVGGGRIPMTNLLDNMIAFRGINMGVDGHKINRQRQNTPISGGYSLNGLVADQAKKPFPSVFYRSSLNYKSKSGAGAVNVTSSNPILTLMSPFQVSKAQSFGVDTVVEEVINDALDLLEKKSSSLSPRNKNLYGDRKNAKKLFERQIGDLAQVYSQLLNKYESLIQSTFAMKIPGISNRKINIERNNFFRMQDGGTRRYLAPGKDLRDTIIVNGKHLGSGSSAPSGQKNTTISNLATNMALAEYCLVNNLSSSITLSITHLANLYIEESKADSSIAILKNRSHNNDQHGSGKYTTMFHNTYYYLALSSCMLEFFSVLKNTAVPGSTNMFDKTIFHLSTAFARSARTDGSGSDHGWSGSSSSIFSGMIKSADIIGNITTHPTTARGGSWGHGAITSDINDRVLVIGNLASSIAAVLGIESPTPNEKSLLGLNGDTIVNYAEKAKNL